MAKTQTLSFPIRLPDALQAEALRLLDASRSAINQIIVDLWKSLDLFARERTGPAWKQVEHHLLMRSGHGNRQERCEMESAGRILRAQASRKQVFQKVLPLLSEGLIREAQGKRPARKDHRQIKEQVRALRAQMQDAGEDAEAFMAMTNVLEQACNRYLQTEEFPTTYEELQPAPMLSVGQLTFAGDDGMAFLLTYHETKRYVSYRMTSSEVKPALYSSAGATLLLPSQGITPRPHEGKHISYAGWSYSTSLRTSRPKNLLAVLSTSQLRKYMLQPA